MPTPPPPCRVYVILAREAPIGVIFRRGPSKRVQIIHWNTDTDTFTPGQWFRGRIYEKRSDLSPNGELLIYTASKETAYTHRDKEYTSSWTAISKPPYLTALALWPCLSSVGGGLFFSDTKVWLNHYGSPQPHSNHVPQRVYAYNSADDVSEEVLLNRRLERDGWRHTQEWQGELRQSEFGKAYQERKQSGQPADFAWMRSVDHLGTESHYVNHAPGIHEKPHPSQSVTLLMTTTRSGYRTEYRYSVRQSDGTVLYLNNAEWADWDTRGRLVLAQDGGIFAQDAGAIGREPPVEMISLNENMPEPMVAPDWAKIW